jgi:hypothetical protein
MEKFFWKLEKLELKMDLIIETLKNKEGKK